MWFIGVEESKRRGYPLLKKILDPPLLISYVQMSVTVNNRPNFRTRLTRIIMLHLLKI